MSCTARSDVKSTLGSMELGMLTPGGRRWANLGSIGTFMFIDMFNVPVACVVVEVDESTLTYGDGV